MTPEHILFIPTVFFLGFFLGGIVSQINKNSNSINTSKRNLSEKEVKSIFTSIYPLGFSFFILISIFIATHVLPFFGGAKALSIISNGKPLFDQRPVFTNLEFYHRLNYFGEAGREMYQRFTYTVDIIFPLALLSFLILLTGFIANRNSFSKKVYFRLLTIPILWFLFDMIENSILFFLIGQFPIQYEFLSANLGIVTYGKFCLLFLSIFLPGVFSIYLRIRISKE